MLFVWENKNGLRFGIFATKAKLGQMLVKYQDTKGNLATIFLKNKLIQILIPVLTCFICLAKDGL